MTTVISRLYKDRGAAAAVVQALQDVGFPEDLMDVISAADGDVADALSAARVKPASVPTYVSEITGDTTAVVVRAPFTPFGAAREAIKIVDRHGPMASAVTDNNVLIRETPSSDLFLSVNTKHPLFMTSVSEMSRNRGHISLGFGWKLLSRKKQRTSAMSGGRYMSKAFWPMPLLSKKKDRLSVYRGGKKFLTS